MEIEIEIGLAKIRHDRRENRYTEETLDKEERDRMDIEEAIDKMMYKPDKEKIDFRRKRPTDCKKPQRDSLA